MNMHHDSPAQETQQKQSGINPIGKKVFGIVLFFLGLVSILGGYVASYVFQSSAASVLGLIAGFILIVGGAELVGVE